MPIVERRIDRVGATERRTDFGESSSRYAVRGKSQTIGIRPSDGGLDSVITNMPSTVSVAGLPVEMFIEAMDLTLSAPFASLPTACRPAQAWSGLIRSSRSWRRNALMPGQRAVARSASGLVPGT